MAKQGMKAGRTSLLLPANQPLALTIFYSHTEHIPRIFTRL